MVRKTRSASSAPLAPPDVRPVGPPEGSDNHGHEDLPRSTRRRIKPTIRAAGFVHQTGQQRALLAAKDAAAEPPSAQPSTDQFDTLAIPMVTSFPSEAPLADPLRPDAAGFVHQAGQQEPPSAKPSTNQSDAIASPTVTLLPSEAPSADPLRPVASPTAASSPSSSMPLDSPGSGSADPMYPSPKVSPLADQPIAGPSRIAEVQLDPIFLALTTALTLDLESTVEDDNEVSPPPSQFPDNPIAGIPATDVPAARSPTGDAPEANRSTPSTPTSGRRTARINSILAAYHDELDKILMKAVGETSCSVQQVLDSWNKSCGRVITATNHWNLWPSYLAKHEEEERLRAGVPMDAPHKFVILLHSILQSHVVQLLHHCAASFIRRSKKPTGRTGRRF